MEHATVEVLILSAKRILVTFRFNETCHVLFKSLDSRILYIRRRIQAWWMLFFVLYICFRISLQMISVIQLLAQTKAKLLKLLLFFATETFILLFLFS